MTTKPNSILDAIEQYAHACEQSVRARTEFTSYAARDAATKKAAQKRAVMLEMLQELRKA